MRYNVGNIITLINYNDEWAKNANLIIGQNYTVKNVYNVNGRLAVHDGESPLYISPDCFKLYKQQTFKVNDDGTFKYGN